MSGYLANLVRRATALEPAIRPRLPSIFGPAPASAWDGPATVSEDDSHAESVAPRREDPASAASDWPTGATAKGELQAEQASAPQRPEASPLRADGIVAPSVRSVTATAVTDHPSTRPRNATTEAVSVPLEAPARAAADDVGGSSASTVQTVSAGLLSSVRTGADDVVRSNDAAIEAPRPAPTRATSNAARDDRDEPLRLMMVQNAQVQNAPDRVEPTSLWVAHADLKADVSEPPRQSSLDRSDQTSGETAEFEVTPRARNGSDKGRRWPQVSARARQDWAVRSEVSHDEHSLTAQPVVHVSIGRVEVRASMSAEPRQRARSSTGATSLDDYLRQRSGRSGS